MEAKQRLTVASTWLFERIGVHEIRESYKSNGQFGGDTVEYAPDDEAFVIKTNDIDKSTSRFGNLMPDFIDEQRNKDLLDMPRVRRIEVSDMVDIDGIETHESTPEKNRREMLLAFDNDSDQEIVSVPNILCTRYWLSSSGGLGCFESSFEDILVEVARLTGTHISVKEDINRIQVTGNCEDDVADALGKLSRIEKPLSLAVRPRTAHILQAPTDDGVRFRIANCGSINEVALRRILTDPTANIASRLRQMFVTLLLNFDSETQHYVLPDNLNAPTPCTYQPGKSRIWQDFKFQEIGNGEGYLSIEAEAEKEAAAKPEPREIGIESNDSSSDIASEVGAVEHPYMTEERVKEVGKWVSEGLKKGAVGEAAKQEIAQIPKLTKDIGRSGQALTPEPKKVAGIKTRRPLIENQSLISAAHVQGDRSSTETVSRTETPDLRPSEKKDITESPDNSRKKWIMTYDASENKTLLTSSLENDENGQSNQTGVSGQNGVDIPGSRLIPETPERLVYISGIRFPANFDRNKYGSPAKSSATERGGTPNNNTQSGSKGANTSKSMRLIDIDSPSDSSLLPNNQCNLSFDQPALIPGPSEGVARNDPFNIKSLDNDLERDRSLSDYETAPSESRISETAPATECDNLSTTRISELRYALETQELEEDLDLFSVALPPVKPSSRANMMYKERLAALEKASKKENEQLAEEQSTRQFRRTMGHRAPKPSSSSMSKAEMKAKRQATLEDAWGVGPSLGRKTEAAGIAKAKTPGNKKRQDVELANPKDNKEPAEFDKKNPETLRKLFNALQPTLEAAQSFPGKLSLEMQIGLILIPLLPKTYKGDLISADEWKKIFNPRAGVFAPSTNFIQRVTSSGTDVDHIVDLRTSKDEGKRRLFEQDYTDYSVIYEYHCRTKNDQAIILVIDEAGNITVRKPAVTLGAVNLHFPGHTWDVNVAVSGFMEQVRGSDKELDKAIRHITENLWIPPDRSLLRIYTRIPEGNELNVDKVLMKRSTLHRSLRSQNDTKEKEKVPLKQRDENNAMEEKRQDVHLKITEVQDLWTGVTPADNRALRARCGPPNEMIEKGRLWHEVSIISPTMEDVLRSNSDLEVGECTQDWSPTDLMGNEAHLVLPGHAKKGNQDSKSSTQSRSPVAAAIGSAGIGELFCVASTVVQKMDSVGFWNLGPGVDAVRKAAGFEALFSTTNFFTGTVTGAPSMSMVKVDPKGKTFDDLQSVQEMDSASMAGDREVLEFW
ncbi:conserved hypothetical protein [Paecilomyces variotii No. 5]|uniref:Uncharacterized protein n=1 Tax=Byssochlamys spectabilis (strain No. 5 / NBRC 109023) TaxID=1356009 RepID=V5G019_BYSSN|nr:conserved hypothetical protein [Paecilomyces variotii No. 5]